MIDNFLSHEARYLKCRVLGMIRQGNKVKVQGRQQQLIQESSPGKEITTAKLGKDAHPIST